MYIYIYIYTNIYVCTYVRVYASTLTQIAHQRTTSTREADECVCAYAYNRPFKG